MILAAYRTRQPLDISMNGCVICPGIFFFFFFLGLLRAAPAAYGGSQARGLIRAAAAGLRQSHGNAGSELPLQLTPQLTATPDP